MNRSFDSPQSHLLRLRWRASLRVEPNERVVAEEKRGVIITYRTQGGLSSPTSNLISHDEPCNL